MDNAKADKVSPRGDLRAAHRGYLYQDLITAFSLAQILVSRSGSVTADKKLVPDDRFDDLTVRNGDGTIRRQLKWSEPGSRKLKLDDLLRTSSSVNIADLVRSFGRDTGADGREYRLCVAWDPPDDPLLAAVMTEVPAEPSIPGLPTACYRLNDDRIWPLHKTPSWSLLVAPDITREMFTEFCQHFLIEAGTPPFSGDLSRPGPLEGVLLRFLVDRIGIGEYPNSNRTAEDVAARLINLAAQARTERLTLTSEEIAYAIDLRVDHGRVAQSFPLDAANQVERQLPRNQIATALDSHSIVALVGPPGSGKSWELTSFAAELRKQGQLVAFHYCFLEPGDVDVERRITTDVLFANLIADLLDADPELVEGKTRVYSATARELERVLDLAAKKYAPEPVTLIVDGIDHISRVFAGATGLRREETDIVEELASLAIPLGVRLVIGSQPGKHLKPLEGLYTAVEMPSWSPNEVVALAERLGFRKADISDEEERKRTVDLLIDRADGNPLYATFLIRSLLADLEKGYAHPSELVSAFPAINGDISKYYEHLYASAGAEARIIANLLGVMDFAVTEVELREIVPSLIRFHVPIALNHLYPILVNVAGQGGLRVFHESFRRFIIEKTQADGGTLEDTLAPVVKWLEDLGFFKSPRSFRYLLPSLRRAGRIDELLAYIGKEFVTDSLYWGYSRDAIARNLSLATDVAAQQLRWEAVARFSELYRSLHTCFSEHLHDPLPYWEVFLTVFGSENAASRLLLDGRPVLPKHLGLVLCSMVDDARIVPPWAEYAALPAAPIGSEDGARTDAAWAGRVLAAILHSRIRLNGEEAGVTWLRRLLAENELSARILKELAARVERSVNDQGLEDVFADLVSPDQLAGILMDRSERKEAAGDRVGALSDMEASLALAPSLAAAARAVRLGLDRIPCGQKYPEPDDFDIGLKNDHHYVEPEALSNWVDSVAVLACSEPSRLAELESRLVGAGWYRLWLKFVLQVTRAEVLAKTDRVSASEIVVTAFETLTLDTHPFRGKPRACDLSSCRGVIQEVLARGLALLTSDEDFSKAVAALDAVIDGTACSFQGCPSGPLLRETMGTLLLPYVSRPSLHEKIIEAVHAQVSAAEASGEYFSNHTDIEFAAAKALSAVGDGEAALEHWRNATIYLGGYGSRKDATFYQLLEALPGLFSERGFAQDAMVRLQALSNAVISHTDGKGTDHMPNSWLRNLADLDPSGAVALVARSQAIRGGRMSWQIEEGLRDVLRRARSHGDPTLFAIAEGMLRFDLRYKEDADGEITDRLDTIKLLWPLSRPLAEFELRSLAARAEGDHHESVSWVFDQIRDVAQEIGVTFTTPTYEFVQRSHESTSAKSKWTTRRGKQARIEDLELVPINPSPLQTMAWIRDSLRNHQAAFLADPDRMVSYIGYRCVELACDGREDEAARLLRFFARELPAYEQAGAVSLGKLGDGFKRFELNSLAATAYSLAFTRSRGGGGWDSIGGDEHAEWLRRALALDRTDAMQTLATELAQILQSGGYVMGITPALVRRVAEWGDVKTAVACWEEAYLVVKHRLPSQVQDTSPFLPYNPADVGWTVDEAVASIVLGRICHPELERKRSALLALWSAIVLRPDAVTKPLIYFLSQDGTPTSPMLIMQVLLEAEEPPYVISRALAESGLLHALCRIEMFGPRAIARGLLKRIGVDHSGTYERNPVGDSTPTQARIEEIASLDWGDRLQQLAKHWPAVEAEVAQRFHRDYEGNPRSRERSERRYKFSAGRDRSMSFWTPMLSWESEIFEVALHEALNGLKSYLWTIGEVTEEIDDELLQVVLPNVRLQVALEASRSVRPDSPLPSELTSGTSQIETLPPGDEFADWVRLGRFEREYLFPEQGLRWGNPNEVVFAEGATISSPLGRSWNGKHPFAPGEAAMWLLDPKEVGPTHLLTGAFVGHVVGADRYVDLLGDRIVIMLHPSFARRFGLKNGPWPGRLQWLDQHGDPAVVMRTWSVRSLGSSCSDEQSLLEGCELIVSPAFFRHLQQDAAGPISWHCCVDRTTVPRKRSSR